MIGRCEVKQQHLLWFLWVCVCVCVCVCLLEMKPVSMRNGLYEAHHDMRSFRNDSLHTI